MVQLLLTMCKDFELHCLIYDTELRICTRLYDSVGIAKIICIPNLVIESSLKTEIIAARDEYLKSANLIFDPKYLQPIDWKYPETCKSGVIQNPDKHQSFYSWSMIPGFPSMTSSAGHSLNETDEQEYTSTGRPKRQATVSSSTNSKVASSAGRPREQRARSDKKRGGSGRGNRRVNSRSYNDLINNSSEPYPEVAENDDDESTGSVVQIGTETKRRRVNCDKRIVTAAFDPSLWPTVIEKITESNQMGIDKLIDTMTSAELKASNNLAAFSKHHREDFSTFMNSVETIRADSYDRMQQLISVHKSEKKDILDVIEARWKDEKEESARRYDAQVIERKNTMEEHRKKDESHYRERQYLNDRLDKMFAQYDSMVQGRLADKSDHAAVLAKNFDDYKVLSQNTLEAITKQSNAAMHSLETIITNSSLQEYNLKMAAIQPSLVLNAHYNRQAADKYPVQYAQQQQQRLYHPIGGLQFASPLESNNNIPNTPQASSIGYRYDQYEHDDNLLGTSRLQTSSHQQKMTQNLPPQQHQQPPSQPPQPSQQQLQLSTVTPEDMKQKFNLLQQQLKLLSEQMQAYDSRATISKAD